MTRPAAARVAPPARPSLLASITRRGLLPSLARPGLLASLLACAGCPHPPVERPYPPPAVSDLLARLDTQLQRAGTLRSAAKVDYLGEKGERVKLKMTFVVRAPAALRIEAESPLGGTVASLASDGERFQLLDVRGNRFLAGAASPCNIARLIRVGLHPADVVALVAGAVPRPVEVSSTDVGWDGEDGGRDVLTLHAPGGEVETIRFASRDRGGDAVGAELRGADGKTTWKIEQRDFSDAGGVRLPERTDVAQPTRDADARIRWKSREPQTTVPDSVFHLDPPAGIPVENVTCEG